MIIKDKETKKDLRIKRTEKAIRKSFIKLMAKKGFDRILVKDITDEAMISRNTFYLHYADKYDLLDTVCNELIEKLTVVLQEEIDSYIAASAYNEDYPCRIMIKAYQTVCEDKELYRLLLMDESVRVFRLKLKRLCELLVQSVKGDLSWIDGLSFEYMFDGLVGVVKYWVTHEDIDIEREIVFFVRIHFSGIINLLNKRQTVMVK